MRKPGGSAGEPVGSAVCRRGPGWKLGTAGGTRCARSRHHHVRRLRSRNIQCCPRRRHVHQIRRGPLRRVSGATAPSRINWLVALRSGEHDDARRRVSRGRVSVLHSSVDAGPGSYCREVNRTGFERPFEWRSSPTGGATVAPGCRCRAAPRGAAPPAPRAAPAASRLFRTRRGGRSRGRRRSAARASPNRGC